MAKDVIEQLIRLSNRLGDPARDYAILGEGNTSARIDGETFAVKASGAELRTASREHFVRVRFAPILALLEGGELPDADIERALRDARAGDHGDLLPSVETMMHAVLLNLDGVEFVGHTHPTAVNAFTCSRSFEEAVAGRLFPDEIVLCGPASVAVPYVDPGLPLARAIRDRVNTFIAEHGERPKVVHLQNHGMIALGATARQVEDTTAMAVKAARILLGTQSFGGPSYMAAQSVERIHRRPDEHYRQRMLDRRTTE